MRSQVPKENDKKTFVILSNDENKLHIKEKDKTEKKPKTQIGIT